MERNHKNYEEGEVLRDLSKAGVKIKQVLLSVGKEKTNDSNNSKVIVITKKALLGIKRLGKIDFLMNFCKGYLGIEKE